MAVERTRDKERGKLVKKASSRVFALERRKLGRWTRAGVSEKELMHIALLPQFQITDTVLGLQGGA